MDAFCRHHQPLFKHVLLAEWFLLVLAIGMSALALPFRPPETMLRTELSIGALTVVALLSLSFPDRPQDGVARRLAFIFMDLTAITVAVGLGVGAYTMPLFLIVPAKSCLLFTGNILRGLLVLSLLMPPAVNCWKLSPALNWHTDFGQTLISSLAAGLILNVGNIAWMCVVTAFMRSMLAEQQLRQKAEDLAKEMERLSAQLERTRIAREVHDTLGHTLTSLKLQLEVARRFEDVDSRRARDALASAEQLAGRSLADVRIALQGIRQTDFDFEQAVLELARDAEATGKLAVKAELGGNAVPRAVAYQLFRILQECMTNTMKHAQAKNVLITATAGDGNLTVVFEDDGHGLKGVAHPDSYGVKGMQERIDSLKGTLAINERGEGGTRVTVQVPLCSN